MGLPDISDVPLTKDIIAQRPKFIPTYYEWLKVQGEEILRDASSSSANIEIFTVPTGQVLFLTSASVNEQLHHTGGSTSLSLSVRMRVGSSVGAAASDTIIEVAVIVGNALENEFAYHSNSHSFTLPLKIEEGRVIWLNRLSPTGTHIGSGVITGFLVNKEILTIF